MACNRCESNIMKNVDREELKNLKVKIVRSGVTEPDRSGTILRSLDDPHLLSIHFRDEEGQHSIFDHKDVIVNLHPAKDAPTLVKQKLLSFSCDANHECSHRDSDSRRSEPSTSHSRRSRSPPPRPRRRQMRSRSPPPRRGRSRSRDRRSRSPSYHRYELRRSRSPAARRHTRYSPERRRRSRSRDRPSYDAMPPFHPEMAYYPGGWFPPAMPPRFMPPGYMPAAPYPGMPPLGMNPVMPPRMPLRPRIPIYNHRIPPTVPPTNNTSAKEAQSSDSTNLEMENMQDVVSSTPKND